MGNIKSPLLIMSIFLWIGFVCAISFMEAWLKFQAPGITLPLGLGIGRLVFNALNKVEWVFALVSIFCLIKGSSHFKSNRFLFVIPLLILIVQSVWLLPVLDYRAQLHIDGAILPSSAHHIYYVAAETLKVICLLWFGMLLFNPPQKKEKLYEKSK